MKLVIVESPTKARTLARFLGREYKIEASMGHVRDLPEKGGGMAIDVEHDFAPQYQILSKKKTKVAELRALAKGADEIFLAPDPDREGEAIAYHVAYLLQGGKSEKIADPRFRRVTFHEITESAIKESLKHPGKINMQLVNAQQARRVLDRLVGYTLSPVLWRKVRRGLSAGRVQSVAVRLIVERELEIEAFVPEEYWQIMVELSSTAKVGIDSQTLLVELIKKNGKTLKINSGEQAQQIVTALEMASYVVSDLVSEEQKSSPNPPFTTSLLQRAASNLWGWSAKATMMAAQSLYEHGFITYHRTDSYNLAGEAVTAIREYISTKIGKDYLPEKPRLYKTKAASAQEAHEAIRPTDVNRSGDAVLGDKLSANHQKLYELIRTRTLQCQMKDAIFDKSTIVVLTQDKVFQLTASGKRIIFDGYLKLGKPADETFLPKVAAGEALSFVKLLSTQKFTKPSARYSEAGLIKELEKRGIGRPSTYAAIISTIQDRNYVVKEAKSFLPTTIGRAVIEYLIKYFDNVIAYDFTAKMENDLDAVALGKQEWISVVKNFWEPFIKSVKQADEGSERVKVPVEPTGEKCPECKNGEVVIRTGKFGKFLSCSLYPECKYTNQYREVVKDIKCPTCGSEILVRKSKKGAKFFGCSSYPTCKWAAWKLPEKKIEVNNG